jgi:hypothetical protein
VIPEPSVTLHSFIDSILLCFAQFAINGVISKKYEVIFLKLNQIGSSARFVFGIKLVVSFCTLLKSSLVF